MFRNGRTKSMRSSYKGMIDNGTPSLSSDSEMTSKIYIKIVRIYHAHLTKIRKVNCHSLIKDDDDLFKNTSKRPSFVLRPLKTMLNFELDRLYLQQLEYELDCTDFPLEYDDILVTLTPLYTYIQLEQATKSIISYF